MIRLTVVNEYMLMNTLKSVFFASKINVVVFRSS